MELLKRLAGLFGRQGDGLRAEASPAALPTSRPKSPLEAPPRDGEARRVLHQVCEEAVAASADRWRVELSDSARWQAVKHDAPELQIALMWAAIDRSARGGSAYGGRGSQVAELRKSMVSQLLRRNLPFAEADLVKLLGAWLRQPHSLEYGLPGNSMLGAVERYAERAGLSQALRQVLDRLRSRALAAGYFGQGPTKYSQGVAQRIAKLLDPSASRAFALPAGPFGERFQDLLSKLPERERRPWSSLASLAVDAGDKSKPTRKWLEAASLETQVIDGASLMAEVSRLLDGTTPDPARPDSSLDILKGLIWTSTLLDHGEMAGQVGRFAEKCFRKVPGAGARSVKLGNAAIWALSEMAGEPRAAAELFRLRQKIKYPSTRKVIDDRLAELARRTGQGVEDLEDLSLPDFGLGHDGTATFNFGEARADLALQATGLDLGWFNGAGRPVKSVPMEVRSDHRDELVAFQRLTKEIDEARAAQVLRLEHSWFEDRSWSFADWQTRYQKHPLRRPIVEALIWRIDSCDVLSVAGALTDLRGQARDFPEEARVTLWHPLDSEPQQVLAWRQRILDVGITQPIKQAHREIYVLTDAERQTRVYSNRFAAHILRQHQFRALCQARGWTYDLMGGWDGWNVPTRVLPKQGLAVEYHVEVVDDGQHSGSGVSLHLASDQVRFVDARKHPVELEAVSPIVLSEVLRDVDLFVAVTSVANDPGWTDGGPDGRHGGYWREWAFGELGQSAATRRELITWIVPKLSIADKLEVTGNFLIVQGKRQAYAIHFGSSNIQILPTNRYLCIVPDRSPVEASGLRLPFAGDGMLSAILAKAFLLVDESKIKDPTILRQL